MRVFFPPSQTLLFVYVSTERRQNAGDMMKTGSDGRVNAVGIGQRRRSRKIDYIGPLDNMAHNREDQISGREKLSSSSRGIDNAHLLGKLFIRHLGSIDACGL